MSLAGGLARRARGRGSGYGINGTILATGVGSIGKVLEANTREAGRSKPEVGKAASGAGAIQSRAAGTQERFPRCWTPGEATGGPGIDSELCARCRAASMANGNTQEVSVEARSGAPAQPIGVTSGRGPY